MCMQTATPPAEILVASKPLGTWCVQGGERKGEDCFTRKATPAETLVQKIHDISPLPFLFFSFFFYILFLSFSYGFRISWQSQAAMGNNIVLGRRRSKASQG